MIPLLSKGCSLTAALLVAAMSQATVIYSTSVDSSGDYVTPPGLWPPGGGFGQGYGLGLAEAFQTDDHTYVSLSVTGAWGVSSAPPSFDSQFTVSIAPNELASPYGTSGNVPNMLSPVCQFVVQAPSWPYTTVNFQVSASLAPNTVYWVVVTSPADDEVSWQYAGDSQGNQVWGYGSGQLPDGSWVLGMAAPGAGAVSVQGTAVPEPLTLALCAGGLGLAIARRRKANRG